MHINARGVSNLDRASGRDLSGQHEGTARGLAQGHRECGGKPARNELARQHVTGQVSVPADTVTTRAAPDGEGSAPALLDPGSVGIAAVVVLVCIVKFAKGNGP